MVHACQVGCYVSDETKHIMRHSARLQGVRMVGVERLHRPPRRCTKPTLQPEDLTGANGPAVATGVH